MNVPFLDLKPQLAGIRGEIDSAVNRVLDSTAFASGPFVETFENEFASFCGCARAVGVASGTEAIQLVLCAAGIGKGDEVITVPNTFIATVEAIVACGAKPVLVDVDESTFTMNPSLLEAAITHRTRAVIPVHLYGQVADMDPILAIARRHGLTVIEDACQAHGAVYKGRRAGSLADAGCFSFYPGKNLGACGEAGAVTTNNDEMADAIKSLRDHGQSQKYYHDVIGQNSRMDGIQAAVLSVKLKYLPEWNRTRREHAMAYNELLRDTTGVKLPAERDYGESVYHIYCIRVEHRDLVKARLAQRDVVCGIHYPMPIHLQKAWLALGFPRGSFPVSERCAADSLSLPMFPELSSRQIEYVAEQLMDCLQQKEQQLRQTTDLADIGLSDVRELDSCSQTATVLNTNNLPLGTPV